MSQDTVKINIDVASKAAEEALKRFKEQTDNATSSFNIFKGSFAAGLAVNALTSAFSAVTGTFSSFISEASEAQANVQKLADTMERTGRGTPEATQALVDFAGELQNSSVYADDLVLKSTTLLANLTSLSTDGLKQATQAAADLATTLNIDLESATQMIAKAVNGNMMAFSKLGIEIKKGVTDSDNLTNVMAALANQQGAAANQAKTYQGALARLNNAKSDLFESIGNLIVQSPVAVQSFESMTSVINSLSKFITDNKDNIYLLAESLLYATGIVGTAAAAFYLFTGGVAALSAGFAVLKVSAALAWAAITGPVALVVGAIAAVGVGIYLVVKYWDDIKIKTYEALAVGIEYSSKIAELFSSGMGEKLKAQADGFRDKAQAIREAQAAAEAAKKSESEATGNSNDAPDEETLKQKAALAERLQMQREYAGSVQLIQQDANLLKLEEENRYQQDLLANKGEFDLQDIERQNTADQELLLKRQAFEQEQLRIKSEAAINKALIIEDELQREKALLDAKNTQKLDSQKLANQQELDLIKLKNKQAAQLERDTIKNRKDTFATISSLQNSNNKSLAAAGKAYAVYQIAVDTPVAISKALASGIPFPGNIAAAALVGAAMAEQAAKVAGISFQTGGIVPGNKFSGDKVQANVNSREMVLNVSQQKKLFDLANGKSNESNQNNSNVEPLLIELINAVKENQSIVIDGREIMNVIKDSRDAGYSY